MGVVPDVNSTAAQATLCGSNVNFSQQWVNLREESVKGLKWVGARHDEQLSHRPRRLVSQDLPTKRLGSATDGASSRPGVCAHRGRHREMTTQVPGTMDTSESVERIFAVAFSVALMDSGHPEAARGILDDAVERGIESIPSDLMKSSLLVGLSIIALGLHDEAAAEWLLPELEPMAGEVSFNGAMSQGPVALWIGRLSAMLGRHAAAEPHLRAALAVADRFSWQYHRAAALTALVDMRCAATGGLDDEARVWLDEAERVCATGIGEWTGRLASVRAELGG